MTLIEVVAAMALMGVLLVAIVTARARHLHQLTLAERQLAAIDAADELIASWYAPGSEDPGRSTSGDGEKRERVPRQGEGSFETVDGLRWQTDPVVNHGTTESADRFPIDIVRLTVTETRGAGRDRAPLVTVDLAVPALMPIERDAEVSP